MSNSIPRYIYNACSLHANGYVQVRQISIRAKVDDLDSAESYWSNSCKATRRTDYCAVRQYIYGSRRLDCLCADETINSSCQRTAFVLVAMRGYSQNENTGLFWASHRSIVGAR